MANRSGNMKTVTDFIFLGSKITADGDRNHEIKRPLLLGRRAMTNLDSILKIRDITLPTKVCLVNAMVFSSSHVWMWDLDYMESWAPKNWCFRTVGLEKTLESLLDCKEINPKGNQSWIFIGRTDVEAIAPILWPTDAKNWLIGRDPDAGHDWRQEEKGTTENEMVGWYHRFNRHEFEQAQEVVDGQRSLACCNPLDCKELDTTEWLNWTWLTLVFSGDLDGKESACCAGDLSLIPGSGKSAGEGNDNPFQYPCLENSMARETWQAPPSMCAHKKLDTTEWLTQFTYLAHLYFAFYVWLRLVFPNKTKTACVPYVQIYSMCLIRYIFVYG